MNDRNRWIALVVRCTGMLMIVLDSTAGQSMMQSTTPELRLPVLTLGSDRLVYPVSDNPEGAQLVRLANPRVCQVADEALSAG